MTVGDSFPFRSILVVSISRFTNELQAMADIEYGRMATGGEQ